MAHHKRKTPRTSGSGQRYKTVERKMKARGITWWNYYSSTPSWWNNVFHTRPARSETRRLEHKVVAGIDPDGVVWPHPRKPHIYYW